MAPRDDRIPQNDNRNRTIRCATGYHSRQIAEHRSQSSLSLSPKSAFLWIFVAITVAVSLERLHGTSAIPVAAVLAAEKPMTNDMPDVAPAIGSGDETPARMQPPQPVPLEGDEPQLAGEQPKTDTKVKVVLNRDNAGNYVGQGKINQKNVKLLADTGASVVVVPERIARQIGLKRGTPVQFRTAGGLVTNYATILDTLSIGPIQISNVQAVINPSMQEDFALLGMSALALLNMTQQDGSLILSYDPAQNRDGSAGPSQPQPVRFKKTLKECLGSGRTIDQKTLNCLNGH